MSRTYIQNLIEVKVGVNGSENASGEMTVSDIVTDINRNSTQTVLFVMGLVEHLNEMISEEDKINAKLQNIQQQVAAVNFLSNCFELETIVGKQKELVGLLKNISEKDKNSSSYKEKTLSRMSYNTVRYRDCLMQATGQSYMESNTICWTRTR
jgi:hypothetical protein